MSNPKIEIINHFDNLINRVDIDIEESLEKYKEAQVIGDLECYESFQKKEEKKNLFKINKPHKTEPQWLELAKGCEKSEGKSNETDENSDDDDLEYDQIYKTVNLWSEETKVVDYLNQVRMRTIEELREAQKEALESYKSQSHDSKRQLFPDKFYFQVLFTRIWKEWIFKLFTFVTDFYISPEDIIFLEKFINSRKHEKSLFVRDIKRNFDEKMILIGLLDKFFFENFNSEKFPSPVISVRKQDLLAIKHISFRYYVNGLYLTKSSSIDLSNLESLDFSETFEQQIEIDGLASLESLSLSLHSLDSLSLNNLPSLRNLKINISSRVNEPFHDLFYNLPSIESLTLNAYDSLYHMKKELSYFKLDSLVNLKSLSLSGILDKDFNFDLFETICNHLETLSISFPTINNTCLAQLFYGHQFPNMQTISIRLDSEKTNFEKKLFDRFPMLQSLTLRCKTIYSDAFSDLKQLISLDLSNNYFCSFHLMFFSGLINLEYLNLKWNRLKRIDANLFSNLTNLRVLDLSYNQLKTLDPKTFSSLKNLRRLNLDDNKLVQFDLCILDYIKEIKQISASGNPIINKKKILVRCKESKIEFKI